MNNDCEKVYNNTNDVNEGAENIMEDCVNQMESMEEVESDDLKQNENQEDSSSEVNNISNNEEENIDISKLQEEIKMKDNIIADLEKKVEETQKAADELKNSLQRVMAEFDNYKKRTAKEKEALYTDAQCDVLKEFLSVVDNMERALENINENSTGDNIKQGVELIYRGLMDTLKKQGVEEIEALNKQFDANLHNAVAHVEDENYGENEVVEVLAKGYKCKDRVLRYSMVKVAN